MSYFRGMGQAQPAGSGLHVCNFIQSIFGGYYVENPASFANTWVTCDQAAANVGTPLPNSGPGGSPTLPPQNQISSLSTDPNPPSGYTSVPMGSDSSGQQLYAYLPSSSTQQSLNFQSILAQFGNLDSGSSNNNGTDCSWLDTPGIINNLFNPSCGIPWGIFAVLGLGLFMALSGLRR